MLKTLKHFEAHSKQEKSACHAAKQKVTVVDNTTT